MPKVHRSPSFRKKIVQCSDKGYTLREIESKLGVPRSTASETIKRFRVHHTTHDLPHPGRPRLLGDRTRRHIIRTLKANPTSTSKEIAELAGGVTDRQVRQIAREAGFRFHRFTGPKPSLADQKYLGQNNVNQAGINDQQRMSPDELQNDDSHDPDSLPQKGMEPQPPPLTRPPKTCSRQLDMKDVSNKGSVKLPQVKSKKTARRSQ